MTHTLIGNVERLPRLKPRETKAWSGAGGHVGGEDVVGVAVQVLAGSTAWSCAGQRDGRRSGHPAGRRRHRA